MYVEDLPYSFDWGLEAIRLKVLERTGKELPFRTFPFGDYDSVKRPFIEAYPSQLAYDEVEKIRRRSLELDPSGGGERVWAEAGTLHALASLLA